MNDQEIEDGVFVPRGLLGSARYAILHKCDAPNTYAKLGEYVYPNGNMADVDVLVDADESVRAMLADRDIKAANLQLLVERVLMWEVQDSAFQVAPELQAESNETMALARGLKQ